jgi:ligand-binding sensor domain-containing protein
MHVQRITLTFLLWLYFRLASAQTIQHLDRTLTTANGLPNSKVTGMVQDRAGFIWIATLDGLARYDGRQVKVFRNRPGVNTPGQFTSLVDNKITQLEETSTGQLLIGTESGNFQLFDPINERFMELLSEAFLARQKAVVNQCHLSADGRHVWGLMPGVRLIDYDRYTKTVRVYEARSLVAHSWLPVNQLRKRQPAGVSPSNRSVTAAFSEKHAATLVL